MHLQVEPGGLEGLRSLRPGIDPASIDAALRLLVGAPELVVVDARVLRLLMGDLAGLIILGDSTRFTPTTDPDAPEPFAWDDESPCD